MKENMYIPALARVVALREETANIRSLIVEPEKKEAVIYGAGQFIEFTLFGHGEFPVSVADVLDEDSHRIMVTVQGIGKVTREVGRLVEGSRIGIRGPFGHGFPVNDFQGRDVHIIAGGVGLAAVWLLLKQLAESRRNYGRLSLLHGARTPGDMIYTKELEAMANRGHIDVGLTVDRSEPGWAGRVGLVTELLRDDRINPAESVAVVCGPGAMMKATLSELEKLGVPPNRTYLSLERRMQCGMGACGHCMIGSKRVCLDGPVFPLSEIENLQESSL